MAEIGCNWARIGPSKSSQSLSIAHKWAVVETEKNNDLKEEEMKKHIEMVRDDNIAIDAIPLASKPPIIVKYKIIKVGIIGHFQLIREDGSSKRYSSMIKMLQGPEDEYERVLWGDLKVMFKPDIMSDVWRSLQGYKVLIWKLFDSYGVHYVRFSTVSVAGYKDTTVEYLQLLDG
ncbi:hypothetical protein Tco_0502130 [Tanacetum coccineum]